MDVNLQEIIVEIIIVLVFCWIQGPGFRAPGWVPLLSFWVCVVLQKRLWEIKIDLEVKAISIW